MTRRERQRRREERARRLKHMILEDGRPAETPLEIVQWHFIEMPRLIEEGNRDGGL